MKGLKWLGGGNDRQLAATTYAGRDSADTSATRGRMQRHHRTGADKAAAKGQAWEDADRQRERSR